MRWRAAGRGRLAMAAGVVVLLGALSGCSGSGDSATSDSAGGSGGSGAPAREAETDRAGGGAARIVPVTRSIITTVDVRVAVEDIRGAVAKARQLAVVAGGFVAEEAVDVSADDPTQASARLVLRVPASKLADFRADVEALGDFVSGQTSTTDVTEEMVDVEARIASQRASLQRLRNLLQRAENLDAVIRIETEIARREADLDSLVRRQAELGDLVRLATLTVTFVPPQSEANATDKEQLGFVEGLRGGWRALSEVALVTATIADALLPFAVLAALVGVPLLWLLRQRRRSAAPQPQPQPPPTPAP